MGTLYIWGDQVTGEVPKVLALRESIHGRNAEGRCKLQHLTGLDIGIHRLSVSIVAELGMLANWGPFTSGGINLREDCLGLLQIVLTYTPWCLSERTLRPHS